MAETRYPVGYGRDMVTMAQLESRYGPNASIKAHPEYWRRIKAWLISKNGAMGIGGAYRYSQPVAPGFAPPGKSFHEKQTFASGFQGYSAIDLVHVNGSNVHRAPYWSEVPKQGSGHPDINTYGVHCNVSSEPWHIQCKEMDGYTSWVNAGRKDPQSNYPLPGGGGGSSGGGGDLGGAPDLKNGDYGLYPFSTVKPTIKKGSVDPTNGEHVLYLQSVLKHECKVAIDMDGRFGSDTEKRVKEMQGWNGLTKDGICGSKTWAAVDKYAT